jgi:hypothetical protein
MADYYQNPNHDAYAYEYADDGYYGNYGYEDSQGSYSDHAESPYNDPDPTHSEPDHYGDHEDVPEGYKLKELKHSEDEIDEYEEGRYEPQGLDHGGDRAQELGELGYEDKVAYGVGYELREREREGRFENTTPKYNTRANYRTYVPQGSEPGHYKTPQHGYKGTIGYAHPDHLPHPPWVLTTPITYHDHHTPPMYIPSIPNPRCPCNNITMLPR